MLPQIGLKGLLQTPKHLHQHSFGPSVSLPLPLHSFQYPKLDHVFKPKPESEPEPSMLGPSQPAPKTTIKFLCSYGGKILPRYPDGKLRYLGGHTRVLAVDRTIPFSELVLKLEELCGFSVRQFRCQLPSDDLDALVSITSDEDLANLIEEYDRGAAALKIRAFLSPPRPLNKVFIPQSSSSLSKSTSSTSSSSSSSSSSYRCPTGGGGSGFNSGLSYKAVAPVVDRCVHQMSPVPPTVYPVGVEKSGGRNIPLPRYGYHVQGKTCHAGHVFLIHNGNHWQ